MPTIDSIRDALAELETFFDEEQKVLHDLIKPLANLMYARVSGLISVIDATQAFADTTDAEYIAEALYISELEQITRIKENWAEVIEDRIFECVSIAEESVIEPVEQASAVEAKPLRQPFDYRTFKPKLGSIPKDPVDAARFKELQKLKSRL